MTQPHQRLVRFVPETVRGCIGFSGMGPLRRRRHYLGQFKGVVLVDGIPRLYRIDTDDGMTWLQLAAHVAPCIRGVFEPQKASVA
jgi:hypothetical protein